MIKLFSRKQKQEKVISPPRDNVPPIVETKQIEYDYIIEEKDLWSLQKKLYQLGVPDWKRSFKFFSGDWDRESEYLRAQEYLKGVTAHLTGEEDKKKIKEICELIQATFDCIDTRISRVEKEGVN